MPLPTPEEVADMNINISNMKDIPSTAIKKNEPIQEEKFNTPYKYDFDLAAKDFWSKQSSQLLSSYLAGDMVGRFTKRNVDIDEFCDNMFVYIKECITSDLNRKKITTEKLKNILDTLQLVLKMFASSIKTLDDKSDIKSIYAFMQGAINSYISNIIKGKINEG